MTLSRPFQNSEDDCFTPGSTPLFSPNTAGAKRGFIHNRENRTFSLTKGCRPAGYVIASEGSQSFDDPGIFVEIPLVNQIRPRVQAWREAEYPGISSITKRLLEHWANPEEFDARRFFFCQLEAAETLIWLAEALPAEKVGIEIPSDGGTFERLCAKMATGSGKTMAMVIAWHILNKATYPQDTRLAKNILVIAPGLTVKNRLAVLAPSNPANYYEAFRIVPSSLFDKLRQGKLIIRNWHALNWETDEKIAKKRSVDLLRLLRHALCPLGQESSEDALFDWIVSDFGLNDAIEAGLVKTPRVVSATMPCPMPGLTNPAFISFTTIQM